MGKFQKVTDRNTGQQIEIYIMDEDERRLLIRENKYLHDKQLAYDERIQRLFDMD